MSNVTWERTRAKGTGSAGDIERRFLGRICFNICTWLWYRVFYSVMCAHLRASYQLPCHGIKCLAPSSQKESRACIDFYTHAGDLAFWERKEGLSYYTYGALLIYYLARYDQLTELATIFPSYVKTVTWNVSSFYRAVARSWIWPSTLNLGVQNEIKNLSSETRVYLTFYHPDIRKKLGSHFFLILPTDSPNSILSRWSVEWMGKGYKSDEGLRSALKTGVIMGNHLRCSISPKRGFLGLVEQ